MSFHLDRLVDILVLIVDYVSDGYKATVRNATDYLGISPILLVVARETIQAVRAIINNEIVRLLKQNTYFVA